MTQEQGRNQLKNQELLNPTQHFWNKLTELGKKFLTNFANNNPLLLGELADLSNPNVEGYYYQKAQREIQFQSDKFGTMARMLLANPLFNDYRANHDSSKLSLSVQNTKLSKELMLNPRVNGDMYVVLNNIIDYSGLPDDSTNKILSLSFPDRIAKLHSALQRLAGDPDSTQELMGRVHGSNNVNNPTHLNGLNSLFFGGRSLSPTGGWTGGKFSIETLTSIFGSLIIEQMNFEASQSKNDINPSEEETEPLTNNVADTAGRDEPQSSETPTDSHPASSEGSERQEISTFDIEPDQLQRPKEIYNKDEQGNTRSYTFDIEPDQLLELKYSMNNGSQIQVLSGRSEDGRQYIRFNNGTIIRKFYFDTDGSPALNSSMKKRFGLIVVESQSNGSSQYSLHFDPSQIHDPNKILTVSDKLYTLPVTVENS